MYKDCIIRAQRFYNLCTEIVTFPPVPCRQGLTSVPINTIRYKTVSWARDRQYANIEVTIETIIQIIE